MLPTGNFLKSPGRSTESRSLRTPEVPARTMAAMATAPWAGSKTPVAPPTAANPTMAHLVYAAVVTGAWSGICCLLIYVLAGLAGQDFAATVGIGAIPAAASWLVIALTPLVAALAFALVSSLLRGRRGAWALSFWGGTAVAVVSLASPFAQPAAVTWPTRVVLASMHVITWLLVVPQIARIVGDSEPGRSVDRSD